MNRAVARIVSVLVLALWVTPSVGALAVTLHVALDHHGGHGTEHGVRHESDLPALLEVATHGHHHNAAITPDHEHEAKFQEPIRQVEPRFEGAVALADFCRQEAAASESSLSAGCTKRAPPVALFSAHCSPLL